MTRVAGIVVVCCALAAAAETPPADPLEGALVSLKVTGGFTPYRSVSYEVLWRGRTAVVNHYRSLVNYDEALHEMRLCEREELQRLLKDLSDAGALTLPSAPTPKVRVGALRYEIEIRPGGAKGKVHTFTVDEPDAQPDPRYARIVRRVRGFVVRATGELPFRNVFFDPGTFGFLNLTSVPAARVEIDGRDIGLETPLYGYELASGVHEVRLIDPKSGAERRHNLRVEPGMTTIVHIEVGPR